MPLAVDTRPGRRRQRPGLSLVEVVVSTVVVGTMLVAALSTVASARVGMCRLGDQSRGMLLAQELMSEILLQPFMDINQTPVVGREPGEGTASRTPFDDLDDYDGLTESPPLQRDGTPVPNSTGWSRSVQVMPLDPADLSPQVPDPVVVAPAPGGGPGGGGGGPIIIGNPDEEAADEIELAETGIKRITVTVSRDGIVVAELRAIRTAAWDYTVGAGLGDPNQMTDWNITFNPTVLTWP